MTARYKSYVLRDEAMHAEARVVASAPEFEERIAARMQEAGVAYFGRLITPSARPPMPFSNLSALSGCCRNRHLRRS